MRCAALSVTAVLLCWFAVGGFVFDAAATTRGNYGMGCSRRCSGSDGGNLETRGRSQCPLKVRKRQDAIPVDRPAKEHSDEFRSILLAACRCPADTAGGPWDHSTVTPVASMPRFRYSVANTSL